LITTSFSFLKHKTICTRNLFIFVRKPELIQVSKYGYRVLIIKYVHIQSLSSNPHFKHVVVPCGVPSLYPFKNTIQYGRQNNNLDEWRRRSHLEQFNLNVFIWNMSSYCTELLEWRRRSRLEKWSRKKMVNLSPNISTFSKTYDQIGYRLLHRQQLVVLCLSVSLSQI